MLYSCKAGSPVSLDVIFPPPITAAGGGAQLGGTIVGLDAAPGALTPGPPAPKNRGPGGVSAHACQEKRQLLAALPT